MPLSRKIVFILNIKHSRTNSALGETNKSFSVGKQTKNLKKFSGSTQRKREKIFHIYFFSVETNINWSIKKSANKTEMWKSVAPDSVMIDFIFSDLLKGFPAIYVILNTTSVTQTRV